MSAGVPSRRTWIQPLRSPEREDLCSLGSGSREMSAAARPSKRTEAKTAVRRIAAIIVGADERYHPIQKVDGERKGRRLREQVESEGVGPRAGHRSALGR